MMMSLGTWRLVIPLSLFTIAIGGRFLIDRLNVRFDRLALIVRQRLDLGIDVAETVIRIHAQLLERLAMLLEDILVIDRHAHGRRSSGSEIFIMVAFIWSENSTPLFFASSICSSKKVRKSLHAHESRIQYFTGL